MRVILIGGTSNAGKSTLTQALAAKLRWCHVSTDSLARHPGRPWRVGPAAVPRHVAEHYLSLTVDDLLADVLRHYQRMWPDIEAMVTLHATDLATERLIVEGSALLPECVATLELDNVGAIWLTGSNDFFQSRIYAESRFDQASDQEKAMIQKFIGRTQLYNEYMMAAVKRLGLLSLDVEPVSTVDELAHMCLALL